jgi:hypothetical protein
MAERKPNWHRIVELAGGARLFTCGSMTLKPGQIIDLDGLDADGLNAIAKTEACSGPGPAAHEPIKTTATKEK